MSEMLVRRNNGAVDRLKSLFGLGSSGSGKPSAELILPKAEGAGELIATAQAFALEASGTQPVVEEAAGEWRLAIFGKDAETASYALREAVRGRGAPAGSYVKVSLRDGSVQTQWIHTSPSIAAALRFAEAGAGRQTLEGLRHEAAAQVVQAFPPASFPAWETYRSRVHAGLLAERLWTELEPSEAHNALMNGTAPLVLPALLLPALAEPEEIQAAPLSRFAAEALKNPTLLEGLNDLQYLAAAKGMVALAATSPGGWLPLRAWLYLCSVKKEALYMTHSRALINNPDNLMNLHIASALNVEAAPAPSRWAALWVRGMDYLEDGGEPVVDDDLVLLISERKSSAEFDGLPDWLQEQVDFLLDALKLSGRFDSYQS